MAHPVVTAVKGLGIDAIELAHGGGEIGLGCFHQQVKVVAHQAVGMQHEMTAGDDPLQHAQEPPPILVVEEEVLAGNASDSDVYRAPPHMQGATAWPYGGGDPINLHSSRSDPLGFEK